MDFLNFMFQSFWHFLGCALILALFLNFIEFLYNRFWRHWNIRKHGYPPVHCDADGEINTEEKEDENEEK